MRKTSEQGVELIKRFEGLRLTAYKVAGANEKYYTIGYGHYGKDVTPDMRITEEQATELLRQDLARFEQHVNSYDSIYSWTQPEFDAMVSFAYNIGSIDLLTQYGKRTKYEISFYMTRYVNAGGKKLDGLVSRRQAERVVFLTPEKEELVGELHTMLGTINYTKGAKE